MAKRELDEKWDPRALDDDGADPLDPPILDLEHEADADFDADAEPPPMPDAIAWENPPPELDEPPHAQFGVADQHVDQPVPRISINAFCDRPEILRLITAAAADRRLAKATITVDTGGVDAAVTQLAAQASPNLLVIDAAAPAAQLLRGLDRLSQVVDEGTRVIIIGAANDIGLYRELMKRGVSEYLVPPLEPLQLIRTITTLYADPDRPFLGRITAVVGAKGGVGASTVAHNLAWALAERRQVNATLIDLDLAFGTTGLDFNQDSVAHVIDALDKGEALDETLLDRMLVKQTERLTLFLAPYNLERDLDFDQAAFDVILDRVRRASPHVILDLPHAWSGWIRRTLLSSDDVIIVTTPDLAGLRNCKNAFDLIRAARPHDPPPFIALNMVGVPKRPEIPIKDFSEALGVEPFASIPFEPAVFGLAANNGQMVFECAPSSKGAAALEIIVQAISGREPPAKRSHPLLDKLERLKLLRR